MPASPTAPRQPAAVAVAERPARERAGLQEAREPVPPPAVSSLDAGDGLEEEAERPSPASPEARATAVAAPPSSPASAIPDDGEKRERTAGTSPLYGVAGVANPPPRYPYIARRQGQEGRVVLRVQVTTAGEAAEVTVRRSSGHPSLDEAAIEAVRRWRFIPASRGGAAVAGSVDVPISFKLTER